MFIVLPITGVSVLATFACYRCGVAIGAASKHGQKCGVALQDVERPDSAGPDVAANKPTRAARGGKLVSSVCASGACVFTAQTACSCMHSLLPNSHAHRQCLLIAVQCFTFDRRAMFSITTILNSLIEELVVCCLCRLLLEPKYDS